HSYPLSLTSASHPDIFTLSLHDALPISQAYVVAHEVGHHVQHLLGISDKVDQEGQNLGEKEKNALSVKLELQADFLAGVWAHYRSEEHTSELQSRGHLVCRLLLEKKKI